jgi:hypothetical protein
MSAIFISHSTKDHAEIKVMASWLKQQGHMSYFIDYDEQSGIRAGAEWEQVLYQRLRQCQAIIALLTPDWLESKWCFAEMIQAREKGKPIFPVITKPCQLPDLLSDTQKIDLIADPEGGYRRLALGLSPSAAVTQRWSSPWTRQRSFLVHQRPIPANLYSGFWVLLCPPTTGISWLSPLSAPIF